MKSTKIFSGENVNKPTRHALVRATSADSIPPRSL